MKTDLLLALAFALLLLPAVATADGYFGATLTRAAFSDGGVELNPMTIAFRGGEDFNENFALEARVGIGIADDDRDFFIDDMVFPVDVGIKTYLSVYGKGALPVNDELSFYGVLGYSYGKVEVSAPGAGSSDGGVSYGFGGEYRFTRDTRMSLEWIRLIEGSLDGNDYEIDGIGVSLVWGFG